MDDKLVTILLFEIQTIAFVFKSLNLSPVNPKYLENSNSISCRVRRKELGKVQVTLQKMAKLC